MIQLFRKKTSPSWVAEQIVAAMATGSAIPSFAEPALSTEYIEIEQCAFRYALVAFAINNSKISTRDKGPLLAAVADCLIQQSALVTDRAKLLGILKLRLNNYFCNPRFGKDNPTHVVVVEGNVYINEISQAGSYFLLLLGIIENDIRFVPWHTHNLEIVNHTTRFILEACTKIKLSYGPFKDARLPALNVDLHESPDKQTQELFRHCQNNEFGHDVLEKYTEGLNCDVTPNGSGPFGCLSNPIPVNGPTGEIKYLSKMRSISGSPVFFHRIGSFGSTATDDSVDGYEIVSTDGTNWNRLYFDMYHPRRSNFAPAGYVISPYKPSLGEDPLLGFGVNFRVHDFPKGIPEAIITSPYYRRDKDAPKLAAIAHGYLQKHEFLRPSSK